MGLLTTNAVRRKRGEKKTTPQKKNLQTIILE